MQKICNALKGNNKEQFFVLVSLLQIELVKIKIDCKQTIAA